MNSPFDKAPPANRMAEEEAEAAAVENILESLNDRNQSWKLLLKGYVGGQTEEEEEEVVRCGGQYRIGSSVLWFF